MIDANNSVPVFAGDIVVRTLVEASIQTSSILRYFPTIIFLVEYINVPHRAVTHLSFIGNVSVSNPEENGAMLHLTYSPLIEKLHGVLYATSSYIWQHKKVIYNSNG